MCGIFGYTGNREAKEILLHGLRRLEYRGYDSAGICVIGENGDFKRLRVRGNLDILENHLANQVMPGKIGIAHTRWATHGAPSEQNAHPHSDCHENLFVVHNGIIENFSQLRGELLERGHEFSSETDTEIIAHLIEEKYEGDLSVAVREAIRQLEGSFAIAVVHRGEPETLVAARRESPLVIGVGTDEWFVASAVPAFLSMTRKVIFLEDNEIVTVCGKSLRITDLDGVEIERKPQEITWDLDAAEKSGYEDFMLKEIFEQPRAFMDTLADKFSREGEISIEGFFSNKDYVMSLRRIVIVACGTSYHAGLISRYLFEQWAKVPVEVEIASEFRYRGAVLSEQDLIIAISQSGETADTLASVREAKAAKVPVIALVNVVGSQMTREADSVIYTHAGPEIGVAATKTFTSQMAALAVLALHFGRIRDALSDGKYGVIAEALRGIPVLMKDVLADIEPIAECAQEYSHCENFLFLGRGISYPVALEGALKLKEISYIHAEGYPAGEMKHGPIALLDRRVPVVAVVTRDSLYEKMVSNIEEVKARGAPVIAIASTGDPDIEKVCDRVLRVPETIELLSPPLTVIPLQLLAYHIAKIRGCNVDQPRNLAKTVTVE